MRIREARLDDIPKIMELDAMLFADAARMEPRFWTAAAQDERMLRESIRGEDTGILVAEVDEAVVGMARFAEREMQLAPHMKPYRYVRIQNAVVSPQYRGKGVGTDLIVSIETWAQRRGLAYIELIVLEENAGARRLYERLGFRNVMRVMRRTLE